MIRRPPRDGDARVDVRVLVAPESASTGGASGRDPLRFDRRIPYAPGDAVSRLRP
jgi:hypothetical protein